MSNSPTKQNLAADPNLEKDFHQLLSTLESERNRIKEAWQNMNEQRKADYTALDRKREETMEFIETERAKIAQAWEDVKGVRAALDNIAGDPGADVIFDCAGTEMRIQRSCLECSSSILKSMFGIEASTKFPKDDKGRLKVDFNPVCFSIILDWLRSKKAAGGGSTPSPIVPDEQRFNMDVLCESLRILDLHPKNEMQKKHNTSLKVTSDTVSSTAEGWQIITAQHPLRLNKKAYFEVKIEANQDPKGGTAIGIVDHVPSGDEVFKLQQKYGVLYNSGNGLVKTEATGMSDLTNIVMFKESATVGVLYDPAQYSVTWYLNHQAIGSCDIPPQLYPKFQYPMPAFGLFGKGVKLKVDFNATHPV